MNLNRSLRSTRAAALSPAHRGLRRWTMAAMAGTAALALAACSAAEVSSDSAASSTPSSSAASTPNVENADATGDTAAAGTVDAVDGQPGLTTRDLTQMNTHFGDSDLEFDAAAAQAITLSGGSATSSGSGVQVSGSTVTINADGVYRLTGTLNGQVVVAAPEDAQVTLVLDNATITNSAGPAIASKTADELVVVAQDGTTNAISDGTGYTVADDSTPEAAIASATDLTIAGTGALNVTGNTNDAISSSDGLVITQTRLTARAADDAVRGQDYVWVKDGTLNLTSEGDGINSDNYEDGNRGWVLVSAGSITANVGNKGINAEQGIQIAGGTLNIPRAVEGLESMNIMVTGGATSIVASDDGINATHTTTAEEAAAEESGQTLPEPRGDDGSILSISGGTVTIDADFDGLDSNGSISLTGGQITIDAAAGRGDRPVDANGNVEFDGATLTANGERITDSGQL